MAELSFGHNVRAKKTEIVSGALNLLPWAQGCLGGVVTPSGLSSKPIIFSQAPVKMLGVSLPEYGSAGKLRTQLCNLPRELRDNEVLVQVYYAGLNPTDCKLRSGALQQLYPLALPVILGCDFSGIIKKSGKSTQFRVGQKVFGRQTLDRIREVINLFIVILLLRITYAAIAFRSEVPMQNIAWWMLRIFARSQIPCHSLRLPPSLSQPSQHSPLCVWPAASAATTKPVHALRCHGPVLIRWLAYPSAAHRVRRRRQADGDPCLSSGGAVEWAPSLSR